MHISSLPCLLMVLAVCRVVGGAPTQPERGLVQRANIPVQPRVPRSPHVGKRRYKKDSINEEVNIQVTDLVVDEDVDGEEVLFEQKVTQIVIQNSNSNKRKNNKRKEAMKQSHQDTNVVIQVVQVIIDVASGNSKRYAVSTILADNGSNQTTTCQITDAQTLTVGNGTCANQAAATDATANIVSAGTATATAAMALASSADVAAPFNMANQTTLLPVNASAPNVAQGVELMDDPAADLADNSTSIC